MIGVDSFTDYYDRPTKERNLATLTGWPDRVRLMQAMDQINQRYGRGSLKLARAVTGSAAPIWQMKQNFKTPAYTTDWQRLLTVENDVLRPLAAHQSPVSGARRGA